MISRTGKTLAVLAISALVASSAPGHVLYHITDLGHFDSVGAKALGINNVGQVVGWADHATSPIGERATLFYNGLKLDLGTLHTGELSWGEAINDKGQVVGFSDVVPGYYNRAVLWSGGMIQDLGDFGGKESGARAINNAGDIVGWAEQPNGVAHPFLYSGGVLHDVGVLWDSGGGASGINDSGQITGTSATISGGRAFLYSGGKMMDLGIFAGAATSSAAAINNSGHIAGYCAMPRAIHAMYFDGVMRDLGTLPGDVNSEALAIDDLDQVVGYSWGNGVYRAVIVESGVMLDLNGLTDESGSGWVLQEATGINAKGQICGYGSGPGWVYPRAFLATPVPEPVAAGTAGVAAMFLWAMWRRR